MGVATEHELNGTAWQDRYFESSDGLTLYYRDYPAPESGRLPLMCLPGLTRNSRDFEALALWLQRGGRRVLTPDLRGRGRSQYDPNWSNYHPGTYLGDLERLQAAAAAERVIVIGTSLGGILAMLIAATRPAAIVGAVLNDVGPEIAPEGLQRIAQYVGRHAPVRNWEEAIAQAQSTYGLALPDLTLADWQALARRSYIEVDGVPRLDMDPMIGDAVRAAPAGAAPDLWPVYAALAPLPVLALRGALSDVLSEATFERMAREKPDLRRLSVARRGHPPLLDEPECLAAIDEFLSTLP
jgi:pimeloyl-ACP methyl ester carboxylesterase